MLSLNRRVHALENETALARPSNAVRKWLGLPKDPSLPDDADPIVEVDWDKVDLSDFSKEVQEWLRP